MRFKYLYTLLIVILGFSCVEDDFLTEVPRDRLTADNLYSTPSGFENGLNALYALVREERSSAGGFHGTRAWLAKGGTDDYYSSRFGGRGMFYIEFGDFLNPASSPVESFWNWLYQINNSANTIIGRAENPDIDWQSDQQKNQVIAQARLIRAWVYRHLINLWGDVPLVLEEATGANIKTDWTRSAKAEIMAQMEEDLLFAEQNLPNVQPLPGRLNNAVAQHYLAELYLMMGVPASAEQKAQAAIDNPNFSLVTDRYGVKASEPGVPFMDQFYNGNVFHNQGNTEVLWAMPHDRDAIGGGGNIMRRSWLIRYSVLPGVSVSPVRGRGTDFYAVTKHAFDLYEEGDDRGSHFAIHRFVLTDEGDTIFTTTEGKQEPTRDAYWPSTAKWDDGDPDDPGRNAGFNDQPYLRLAETYLLLAEAQYLQDKDAEAAETLNILRRRANASEITATDVDIDFILDERTRELLTEEHRRYTLLRLDKWLERTKLYNSQSEPYITERDVLLPIPQAVIDANLGNEMPQNPQY